MTAQIPKVDVIAWREDVGIGYCDPLTQIPWQTLDPARPWLPERLVSPYGLPAYGSLSEAQKLRLSQVEFIASAELGLWLESLLLSRFTRDARPRLDSDPAAYGEELRELREEAGHSLMFLELIRRSGVPPMTAARRRPRFARYLAWATPVQSPLFWAAAFLGEAVPNHFNRLVLQDCTLPDAVRAIVGLHVRDETRHVAYARDRLIRDLPRAGRTARAAYGALLSVAIRQFGRTCFYPPPAAYAAAGIAEPRRLAQAVRASAKRAALIEECMAPARDVLGEYLSLR